MTKRIVSMALFLSALWAPAVLAEPVFIQIFFDEAPVKGVQIYIGNELIGSSDDAGMLETDLAPGNYQVDLVNDDVRFPVSIPVEEEAESEATVIFKRAEGEKPAIQIGVYRSDDAVYGLVAGQVISSDGTPVPNAAVFVENLDTEVYTDARGIYSLVLNRGKHEIEVQHPNFESAMASDVRLFAGGGVNASFRLLDTGPDGQEIDLSPQRLEEVVVLGVFNATDDTESIERYATTIVSAIDAEQLSRFGDSDIAGVLGRISGLSVTDDKFANVRGLDGRYIATNFNGIMMPSTDPMRRDIQLDLFPTGIVETIEVQKSFSADQLATTTGGSISINTKGLPDERVAKISVSMGFNSDFTGDDVLGYRDSESEALGFDNGLRDMHGTVLEGTERGTRLVICPAYDYSQGDPDRTTNITQTGQDIAGLYDGCTPQPVAMAYALSFRPDYDIDQVTADPDIGFDINFGDRLEFQDGELGFYLSGSYGRSMGDRGDAVLDNPNGVTGGYLRSKDNVVVSGYGVVGYEFDSGEILSKTTLLRSTDDVTRRSSGIESREERDLTDVILEYVQRQLFSTSLNGFNEFSIGEMESKFDWRLGYSETDRLEPDRRSYYIQSSQLVPSSVERRWSDLNEVSKDVGFDFDLSADWGSENFSTLTLGALYSEKERDVDMWRFSFRQGSYPVDRGVADGVEAVLSIENIAADAWRLRTTTTATDSYESLEETTAYYFKLVNEIGVDWTVELGARFEDFTQEILYPNAPQNNGILETDDWFPAVNVTWRATEELQFRLGASKTVSYPGLIERSDSRVFDPKTDDVIIGNSNLAVAEIENLDLRVEYYFGESSRASLAFFVKDIDNPVERSIADSSGSQAASAITFKNQKNAELEGIELDFNTTLMERDNFLIFLNGNLSYIDSTVDLSDNQLRLEGETANGRPLQAQSEYLANLQLGLDHFPSDQKITVLVNHFDDRIYRIARGAARGPIMEKGRLVIDLTYENLISDHWVLKFKVRNLTNEPVSYVQNNREIELYETGTSISASLSYEF